MKLKYKQIPVAFFFFITVLSVFSQNPKLIIQNGHSGNFIGDISPDGKHLITGGTDGKILLWDLKSGRHFAPLNNSMFSVTDIKWDEDNQHFYSSDYTGNFFLWDLKTRSIEKHVFNPDSGIIKIIPIPKKDWIFTLGLDSSLRIYDRKLNRMVYKRMNDTYGVCASYLKLNGNEVLIVGCRDSTQKIFSIPDFEELNTTSLGDLLLDVSFNSDFSRVAYTFSSSVNLLAFPSGNPIKTYKIPYNFYSPSGGFSIFSTSFAKPAFYKDSVLLISGVENDFIFSKCDHDPDWPDAIYEIPKTSSYVTQFIPIPGSSKVISIHQFTKMHMWELKSVWQQPDRFISKTEIEMNADLANSFDFSADGKKLLINGSTIHEYSLSDGTSTLRSLYAGKTFEPISYMKDGNRILVLNGIGANEIYINGKHIKKPDTVIRTPGIINTLVPSTDKSFAYVAWGDHSISKINLENYKTVWTDSSLKKVNSYIARLEEVPGKRLIAVFMDDGKLVLIQQATGEIFNELNIAPYVMHTMANGYFSSDGQYFFSVPYSSPKINKWNLKTGKVQEVYDINCEYEGGLLIADKGEKNLIFFGFDHVIRILDFKSGKQIRELPREKNYCLSAKFSPDFKYLITLNGENVFTAYSYPEFKKLYSFVGVRNKGVNLTFTEDNYFIGGKFLSKLFAMEENGKLFPIDQYDVHYNRPDLVLSKTEYGDSTLIDYYRLAYEKRKNKYKSSAVISSSYRPEVEILEREKTPEFFFKRDLPIKVRLKGKSKLNELQVWVNKVPVYGMKPISLSKKLLIDTSLSFRLQHGDNLIEVCVKDENGIESSREIIKVKRMKEEGYNPDLFVVGIGVSEYQMPGYNLRYAAKDAEDFINAIGNEKNGYASKKRLLLKNSEVNKSSLNKIREFLKAADENDVVIIFMAGHGVLDKNLDYYFAAHDLDFNSPEKNGITVQELEEILASINPFQKLLIMDSCHSGELIKEDATVVKVTNESGGEITFRSSSSGVGQNSRNKYTSRLMNKMFMELNSLSGTTILTATAGSDFAMESSELKNGLFTYCFLQGINKMEADLNGDRSIYLEEMIAYLRQKVSQLSNGEQEPNTRYENEYADFLIK